MVGRMAGLLSRHFLLMIETEKNLLTTKFGNDWHIMITYVSDAEVINVPIIDA